MKAATPRVIVIRDERTWPRDVVAYLWRSRRVFRALEESRNGRCLRNVSYADYDHVHDELWEILCHHSLRGYHCTRLTGAEADTIFREGMQPLCSDGLHRRIAVARASGLVSESIAQRLLIEHQANAGNRRGMIWFCFYPPRRTIQPDVERFFRNWGGEALYNSHEDDETTGPILQRIGTACLVEADVPIRSLEKYGRLVDVLARNYLVRRGVKTGEDLDHDNRAKEPISPTNIRRIIQFPSAAFVRLTGCDKWDPPLI